MYKKLFILIFFLSLLILNVPTISSRPRRPGVRGNRRAKHIARDIVKDVKQDVRRGRGRIISKRVRRAIREWKNKEEEVDSAKHIARDIVKDVKQNVRRRRGRIISKRVRRAIREWKNKDQELNFDLEISFNSTDGTCIANANGLTYIFGGMEYRDPSLVYAEEYWGEYPLYLPGNNAAIVVNVAYNGPADQVNMSVVTETYMMELDGSNGAPIDGPNTTDFTVNKGETKIVDSSFILPANAKGLNRIIVKVYHAGNLLMTKEGVFCPPEITQ